MIRPQPSRRKRAPIVVAPEDHAMTQAEVATALGITTGRVSQIERAALAKLRAALRELGEP